ncbi:MAG TPA: NADH-ubiquinone oxidoreductase-F iron-sulfur binding region domain-containing protein [Solirubrobacteraceae bacterium]|nr:NADH-ubiquinone oxidoreductase-F iron-sulfur binding region domain-containing protein [Solirubrobacteraceae bacterium]
MTPGTLAARRTGPEGLPRLLAGMAVDAAPPTLAGHEDRYGPLPTGGGAELIELVEQSGLRGRGGADFPTAVKLRAVAGRRSPIVIVNGSETEPASAKDRLLLMRLPHLVLDGTVLAARAVGARHAVVRVGERRVRALDALQQALAERSDGIGIELVAGPEGYVTGEETAVVHHLERGIAKPTFIPPRPYEHGLHGRPTLVQNPETLAQLALIARYGPEWFRELGSAADPGSVLVTISGAVAAPNVYELAFGTRMTDLLRAAGGRTEPLQALLIGGYFGTWISAARGEQLRLSRAELRSAGAALGSGVVIALGESACGLHETARIISYLAGESAGQCGPCVHGLAAIAESVRALAEGQAHSGELARLKRWCEEVRGRGACHHPDGAARFVQSALAVFEPELERHRHGRCAAPAAGLPIGAPAATPGRRRTASGVRPPGSADPVRRRPAPGRPRRESR